MKPPRRPLVRTEKGLSLIEVLITITVLAILIGALVPAMWDSVLAARGVRAKNDVSQIAIAMVNFQRDVGPFVPSGASFDDAVTAPLTVLFGNGEWPRAKGVAESRWRDAAGEPFDAHLRKNTRNYPMANASALNGWKGPYLATAVAADPWGHRYLANTWCLSAQSKSPEGINCAVFVLSAGPNGIIETPFQQLVTTAEAGGDDIAVRVQ